MIELSTEKGVEAGAYDLAKPSHNSERRARSLISIRLENKLIDVSRSQ